MKVVAGFLEELASRLVPACDPAVVGAVLEKASAGYAGSRSRHGRRVSALTPSGVPFEASVTGGAGHSAPVLRYVTEAATARPFFTARLAKQRATLDHLVGFLPKSTRSCRGELQSFVDVLFPDPAGVPARTRFATFFGLVHREDVPDHLAGLKVYGNLCADEGAIRRLARRWPSFAALARGIDGVSDLVPQFAALEVWESGEWRHKLYFGTRRADDGAVNVLARRFGAHVGDLHAELAGWDASVQRWRKINVGCEMRGGEPALTFYLSGRALGLDRDGMATLSRRLAEQHHGDTRAVDVLTGAATGWGDWQHTIVGIGLRPGGGVGKINAYLAPADDPTCGPR